MGRGFSGQFAPRPFSIAVAAVNFDVATPFSSMNNHGSQRLARREAARIFVLIITQVRRLFPIRYVTWCRFHCVACGEGGGHALESRHSGHGNHRRPLVILTRFLKAWSFRKTYSALISWVILGSYAWFRLLFFAACRCPNRRMMGGDAIKAR